MRPAKLYLIALFQVYIHNTFQVFCGLWSKKHKRKTGIVKKILLYPGNHNCKAEIYCSTKATGSTQLMAAILPPSVKSIGSVSSVLRDLLTVLTS